MPNPPAVLVRLINATVHGQVTWTQDGPYSYSAKLGEATATVWSRDGDGVSPFALKVSSPGKPDVVVSGDTNDERYNSTFRELYSTAATSSVDSSPAVSDLLAELERLEEPPF